MRALTIWQPYASLIVGSPPTEGCPGAPPQKPVENRDWKPPDDAIGQLFAIHAGKRLDLDSFYDVFKAKDFGPVVAPYRTPGLFPRGAVVGVATLDRVIALRPGIDELSILDDRFQYISPDTIASWGLGAGLRWFVGRFGWVFRDARHLAEPVGCPGAQGIWKLSPDIEARVQAQIARAA